MAKGRIPARIKIGTASNREMEQLGVLLEFLRARERAGTPVLMPSLPFADRERYDTTALIGALRKERHRGRLTATAIVGLGVVAVAAPLVATLLA